MSLFAIPDVPLKFVRFSCNTVDIRVRIASCADIDDKVKKRFFFLFVVVFIFVIFTVIEKIQN